MKVKYTCSAMPFKQMENIATFLHALSKLPNFRSFDLFSTVDLYEGKNMAQVIRCVLACKRFAEKEAVAKGIEALKFTEDDGKNEENIEEEEKKEIEIVEEAAAAADDEGKDDFMEVSEPEIHEEEKDEEMEEFEDVEEDEQSKYEESASASASIQPEIILIDSPVLADDESEDLLLQPELQEEYETFTQENPGTFEIQVSN